MLRFCQLLFAIFPHFICEKYVKMLLLFLSFFFFLPLIGCALFSCVCIFLKLSGMAILLLHERFML